MPTDSRISELAEDTTPAVGDYVATVDISDTSMAASGTDKKVQIANLVAGLGYQTAGQVATYVTGLGYQTASNVTSALAAFTGSTAIVTLGTIATGVWSGTTLAVSKIGTGTPGAGKYVDGATGAWTTLPASGLVVGTTAVASGTVSSLLAEDASGNLANGPLWSSTTLSGGSTSGGNLTVNSTSHATKGQVNLNGDGSTTGAWITSAGKVVSVQNITAWNLTTSMASIGVAGPLGEGGIVFGQSGDAALYRSAARTVRLDDAFIVAARNAADTARITRGFTSQSGNLDEWQDPTGATVYSTVSENGYFTTRKVAAPADAELATGEAAFWFDQTAGAAKLMVKAKNASGAVVTGSITLS